MQIYNISINKNRKEATQHGTYGFPMAIYETQASRNVLGYIPWHWHTELQFCYVTNGAIRFYANQKEFILNDGEGIFINYGILHMAQPFQNPNSTFICIDFNPSLIAVFSGSDIEKKYISPYTVATGLACHTISLEISWQKEILNHLVQIYNIYNQKDYAFEMDICINLMCIWRKMITNDHLKHSEYKLSSVSNNLRLKKILTYIHNHYSEKIKLINLSNEIYISTNECCRFFKKHMHCTLFEYLIDYRLIKSAELLDRSEDSISEIAYSCGFGSTSYYIDKFRKKIGCTPLKFRQKQKNSLLIKQTTLPKS